MKPDRFDAITTRYPKLRVALVGDFCLDRYLEIDPARQEVSIETGLPVRNVVRVRSQPGGAGTILNNLCALGVGEISAVGFCGEDGEGFELRRALSVKPGVRLDHFLQTAARRTFTYTKPLVMEPGKAPVELNRLDFKNWTPTGPAERGEIAAAVAALAPQVDAMIVLDQTDLAETGVVTGDVLDALGDAARRRPELLILADSRRGLKGFPPVGFKMNRAELATLSGAPAITDLGQIQQAARALAQAQRTYVFVTLSEDGIVGAAPNGQLAHLPALPVHGEIDIVGAGDAVTANLTAALAAGATLREAVELGNAAASVVIHQLGTTGSATPAQIRPLAAARSGD